ncbi:MAG: DUF938 domain-containing protein [Rhodospirillales bacterium]|jgi:cyclopropane fatty-acyl-phospholipid synthase-like methyltransferase|nr:DUF938 domain-containing protein [Rhodospirillales bacterium]
MPPFSQAAENNKEPIARILVDAFRHAHHILEIGSGTGQHAVHFGRALPHLIWQPSDLAPNLDGLRARLESEAPANVRPPVALDVGLLPWPVAAVDGVFSANAVHIMGWPRVEDLFFGVGDVLESGGTLCLYGPFKYKGAFTTASNAEFDAWLKRQDPDSGIRDSEAIDALAAAQGLRLVADLPMPANNRLLIWRREAAA